MNRLIALTLALPLAVALACAQAEEEPTSDSLPSAPAASPLPDSGTGPSPIVTPVVPTPLPVSPPPMVVVEGPTSYVDPRYKYSIDIPAGFFVKSEPDGGYASVTNYDPRGVTKPDDVRKDKLKVELSATAGVTEASAEEWLAAHTDADMLSTAPFMLDGVSGVQRMFASSWGEQGTGVQYVVKRGQDIYSVAVHYTDPAQLSEVSEMLNSFRFNN